MADALVSVGLYLQTVGLTMGSHWKKEGHAHPKQCEISSGDT